MSWQCLLYQVSINNSSSGIMLDTRKNRVHHVWRYISGGSSKGSKVGFQHLELFDGMVADNHSKCLSGPGDRYLYLVFIIKIKGTNSIKQKDFGFSSEDNWHLEVSACSSSTSVCWGSHWSSSTQFASVLTDCVWRNSSVEILLSLKVSFTSNVF